MRRVLDQEDVLDTPDNRPTELDLVTLAQALWARKLRILLPTLVVAALAAVVVQLITPEYKSTAGLLLQPQESSFTRPTVDPQGSASDQAIDDQAISSQVQVLKSRDLARQVITSMHLVGN